MKQHDTGKLRAYLDRELPEPELQAVEAHLDGCPGCAAELRLLQERAKATAGQLSKLEASPPEADVRAAWRRIRTAEARATRDEARGRVPWLGNVTRSFEMMRRNTINARWRPAVAVLSAVLVVAILLSIAPVREAAADFLGLFRISKFAVIPLDAQQVDRLEQLARQAENAFGEPQITREKGPEQTVADAGQATALAGYAVRSPSRLPDAATLERFTVQAGPAMHMELDRAALEMALNAAGAPVAGLPQTEKLAFDVDVANVVAQEYGLGGGRLEFIQAPSPNVNMPEGLDPVALAEAGFLFLGMPPEDARRLATSIDWTSTLVVPLPTEAAEAREVTVDGVTGLLLREADSGGMHNALLWEKGGILYFMSSSRMEVTALLDAADSLQ